MIESASNTSRRRRQVWLARMRQRDACWVLEVTLKGSQIVSKRSPCGTGCSYLEDNKAGTEKPKKLM